MTKRLRILFLLFIGLACFSPAQGQDDLFPDDLIEQAAEWARQNVDPQVYAVLGVDEDRVRKFLTELQKEFQGTYIYNLAALRDTAARLQPILMKFEETQPYGAWLQAHLDYLEMSEMLRKEVGKAPDPNHLPAPSPQRQRAAWVKVLEARPASANATQHVSRLKKIFAAEGVPPALVWVAEVESSFDPRARSPVGAAGLFQLMPETARSLGLSVALPDERLESEKSGRAAARYLRHLYQRFGDWRLALAAYNAGETRVDALRKGGRPGANSFDAIASRLPAETQMYVPKVEATVRRRERVNLQELGPPKV